MFIHTKRFWSNVIFCKHRRWINDFGPINHPQPFHFSLLQVHVSLSPGLLFARINLRHFRAGVALHAVPQHHLAPALLLHEPVDGVVASAAAEALAVPPQLALPPLRPRPVLRPAAEVRRVVEIHEFSRVPEGGFRTLRFAHFARLGVVPMASATYGFATWLGFASLRLLALLSSRARGGDGGGDGGEADTAIGELKGGRQQRACFSDLEREIVSGEASDDLPARPGPLPLPLPGDLRG